MASRARSIVEFFAVIALGTAALSGCGASLYRTSPYERVPGPVPLARGTAADFSAVVPRAAGETRCEVRDTAPEGSEGRMVTLVIGQPAQRITVMLDDRGAPIRYVDDRGDLSATDGGGGDRTTIALYLTEGYAVAANRSDDELSVIEIPLEEALDSPNLGRPGEMLERVLERCGS